MALLTNMACDECRRTEFPRGWNFVRCSFCNGSICSVECAHRHHHTDKDSLPVMALAVYSEKDGPIALALQPPPRDKSMPGWGSVAMSAVVACIVGIAVAPSMESIPRLAVGWAAGGAVGALMYIGILSISGRSNR